MSSDHSSAESRSSRRLFSSEDKSKIVIRLLSGEDIHSLSGEYGVSVERLARWESRFLEAGRQALNKSERRRIPPAVWQWTGLLLVLLVTVAALTLMLRQGSEP